MVNRTRFRNLTLLLGSMTAVLGSVALSPSLPGMAEAYAGVPGAAFWARQALTLPALFVALGALAAGPLLDRLGRKPIVSAGLLIFALAGTAGFFLDSLAAILVSRAVLGIAVAGITAGFTTLILDYFEGGELNEFLGYQSAAMGLAGMVFLFAAGLMAEFGWRVPFLLHLFGFAVLAGVILFIDEPQRETAETGETAEKAPFPWRQLAPIYLTGFVGMALYFVFPVQIPFYLSEASTSQVGTALALQTASTIVVALLYPRIKARYSFAAIFSLVFLVLALNHFIVALTTTYLVIVAALVIGGIAPGLFPPSINAWTARVAPASLRGSAVGYLTSAVLVGQFASPLISQPFVVQLGLPATFAAAGAASLAVAVVFGLLSVRRKATPVAAD